MEADPLNLLAHAAAETASEQPATGPRKKIKLPPPPATLFDQQNCPLNEDDTRQRWNSLVNGEGNLISNSEKDKPFESLRSLCYMTPHLHKANFDKLKTEQKLIEAHSLYLSHIKGETVKFLLPSAINQAAGRAAEKAEKSKQKAVKEDADSLRRQLAEKDEQLVEKDTENQELRARMKVLEAILKIKKIKN